MKKTLKVALTSLGMTLVVLALVLTPGWFPQASPVMFQGKPVLTTQKRIYLPDEKPHFSLKLQALPTQNSSFATQKVLAAEGVQTEVLYNGSPVDLPIVVTETSEGMDLTINPKEPIKPGKYTLKATVNTDAGPQTTSQNFAWGVLAVNTDKATYLPDETALIQMAVLSSEGHTICNAPLSLEITNPAGQTVSPAVQTSGECQGDTYVTEPDYTATYQVGESGRYKMLLRLADSDYTLSDYFEVAQSVPFDITRTGPTRIYPPAGYAMTFKIHVNQDFNGTVTETLPASFQVTSDDGGVVTSEDSLQQVKWQVNWSAGGDYELSYRFKAPSVSPAFYFIGPLTLSSDEQQIFQESRRWQIAADAIVYVGERGTLNINNGSGTTQAVTVASNATAGNTIILVFATRDTSVAGVSVADSRSNTWTIDVGPLNTFNNFVMIASTRQNTATLQTNDTVTVTFGTAPNLARLGVIEEFSGLQTSAGYVDQTANASASSTTQTTGTTAATAQADELAVSAFNISADPSGVTATHDSSYTDFTTWTQQALTGDGQDKRLATQYKILSATGTQSSTITLDATHGAQGMIVTYKMAAASCGSPTTDQLMRGGNWFCSDVEQGFFWAS